MLCSQLNISYGNHQVLRDVALELFPGQIVALLGPNGAGKSSLLRVLGGVQKAEASIYYGNKKLEELNDEKLAELRALQLSRESPVGAMLLQELFRLGKRGKWNSWDWSPEEKQAAFELARQLQLDNYWDQPLSSLSDGMRQKALLARAFLQDCPLLLLDEPAQFLDVRNQAQIYHLLYSWSRRKEKTKAILFSTHHIDWAIQFADLLAVLDDGTITITSPQQFIKSELLRKLYTDEFVSFNSERKSFEMGSAWKNI